MYTEGARDTRRRPGLDPFLVTRMFGNLLAPEHLLILPVLLLFWLGPLVAFVWALVTLARLRRGQDAILVRLGSLEAALGRPGEPRARA